MKQITEEGDHMEHMEIPEETLRSDLQFMYEEAMDISREVAEMLKLTAKLRKKAEKLKYHYGDNARVEADSTIKESLNTLDKTLSDLKYDLKDVVVDRVMSFEKQQDY